MQVAYTIKDLGVTFLGREFLTMLREGLHNPFNKGPLDIRKNHRQKILWKIPMNANGLPIPSSNILVV